jgi:hypothetical protein
MLRGSALIFIGTPVIEKYLYKAKAATGDTLISPSGGRRGLAFRIERKRALRNRILKLGGRCGQAVVILNHETHLAATGTLGPFFAMKIL